MKKKLLTKIIAVIIVGGVLTTPISVNAKDLKLYNNVKDEGNNYLKCGDFSLKGLFKQLKYVGYNDDEINNYLKTIDKNTWKNECLDKANNYLKDGDFSKKKLIEQLIFECFTDDEVDYAIKKLEKHNWNEECLGKAKSYIEIYGENHFTPYTLREQLGFEKFKEDEINYAISIIFKEDNDKNSESNNTGNNNGNNINRDDIIIPEPPKKEPLKNELTVDEKIKNAIDGQLNHGFGVSKLTMKRMLTDKDNIYKFNSKDVERVLNSMKIDWNEQCVKALKNQKQYNDSIGVFTSSEDLFSIMTDRDNIYGFTKEETVYAFNKLNIPLPSDNDDKNKGEDSKDNGNGGDDKDNGEEGKESKGNDDIKKSNKAQYKTNKISKKLNYNKNKSNKKLNIENPKTSDIGLLPTLGLTALSGIGFVLTRKKK